MNVLIIGAGGREHALGWKIGQSKQCEHLFFAPGNAGTRAVGTNIPLDTNDFEGLRKLCIEEQIKLVVVGPEQPLVEGIVDFFKADDKLN
ncbi:MAG TPA: phosphoribosylamine--glycine ligase family protein, partial [Bacteroidales bacterium]|nr:phosphoribosylamine--glycine ligase family protein [Bacteroidales bacterium]